MKLFSLSFKLVSFYWESKVENVVALYIDLGTGSMLFSVVIGVVATLYFSFRTI